MEFKSKYGGIFIDSHLKQTTQSFFKELKENLERHFPIIEKVYVKNNGSSYLSYKLDVVVNKDLYLIHVLSGTDLEKFLRDQYPLFFIDVNITFI